MQCLYESVITFTQDVQTTVKIKSEMHSGSLEHEQDWVGISLTYSHICKMLHLFHIFF